MSQTTSRIRQIATLFFYLRHAKKFKSGFIAFLISLCISTNCFSKKQKHIPRKLHIEFSGYSSWSKISIIHLEGEEIAFANSVNVNSGMLFCSYVFNKRQAITTGLNLYKDSWGINYKLDKDTYNLPFNLYGPDLIRIYVAKFPFFYSVSVPISKKYLLALEIGGYLARPLLIGEIVSGASFAGDNGNVDYRKGVYYNSQINGGIHCGLALLYPLKHNMIKLGMFADIPLKKNSIGEYTFFPDIPEYTSSGTIESGLGMIGIKLGYVLTHKKYEKHTDRDFTY